MGIASLIVGIFAIIFSALATAPFYGVISAGAFLVSAITFLLGIAEMIRELVQRGRPVDPEQRSGARKGALIGAICMLYSGLLFFFKQTL